jgi:cell wall-associated NlpC family hydrolase
VDSESRDSAVTPAQRGAVIAEAREWIGTPYHSHARLKGIGVDCAMLMREVFVRAKIVPAFEVGHYSEQFGLHRDQELFRSFVEFHAVLTDAPEPGDCVLFKFGRCYSHGGILVDDSTIIHAAMRERSVCYASLSDADLADRAPLFYTIEG